MSLAAPEESSVDTAFVCNKSESVLSVIEKCLDQLPTDLRTTLVLREIEQLSYEEVAEAMRVPIGTVRSRLHTAREKFRKLWLEAVAE